MVMLHFPFYSFSNESRNFGIRPLKSVKSFGGHMKDVF